MKPKIVLLNGPKIDSKYFFYNFTPIFCLKIEMFINYNKSHYEYLITSTH